MVAIKVMLWLECVTWVMMMMSLMPWWAVLTAGLDQFHEITIIDGE
jgi:hypothetical protein